MRKYIVKIDAEVWEVGGDENSKTFEPIPLEVVACSSPDAAARVSLLLAGLLELARTVGR